ncbi:MAG: hypothetical protein EOP80_19340 [Variovorax sp.]|nr:MAG: hypothetical protein EOP80_19340 [Variovorax sp.]
MSVGVHEGISGVLGAEKEERPEGARIAGNTAEPARPGRWCCPRQGVGGSDTKCAKPGASRPTACR